ncbi:MAG: hypothetical protein WCJ81_04710 [bacterium]
MSNNPLNSNSSEPNSEFVLHTAEFTLKCLLFQGNPLGEIFFFAIWATNPVKVLLEIRVPQKERFSQEGLYAVADRNDLILLVENLSKSYKRCHHKTHGVAGQEIFKTAFLNAIPERVLDVLEN